MGGDLEGTGEAVATLAQTADWLGRTPRTLQRWVADGLLEGHRYSGKTYVLCAEAARVERSQRRKTTARRRAVVAEPAVMS